MWRRNLYVCEAVGGIVFIRLILTELYTFKSSIYKGGGNSDREFCNRGPYIWDQSQHLEGIGSTFQHRKLYLLPGINRIWKIRNFHVKILIFFLTNNSRKFLNSSLILKKGKNTGHRWIESTLWYLPICCPPSGLEISQINTTPQRETNRHSLASPTQNAI